MKKLFGGKGKSAAGAGPLCGHLVQVGAWQVRCEALLGSGGYADIYRVTDITNDKTFALKHLRLNKDQEIIAEVQHEARTQAKLKNHPNILRLHAVSFAGPKGAETDGFFLLDYCPGTLLGLLQQKNFQLEERTVLHIFHCVCQAIAHMHSQRPPMAHRDLKAENVLMLPDGTWVLCDFGSSTTRAQVYDSTEAMAAEEEVIRKHTTPAYRPPEMWDLYQRQPIDTKVDVWALGVLLFVLSFGRLPFAGDSKLQILNGKYEMPPTRPPQLRALIRSLLTLNPTERPDIQQALQQLNQVAVAVLGHPFQAPSLREAASQAVAAAQPVQRQQQQPPQQQQRQPQQQQPHQQQQQATRLQESPAAAFSSRGSFWSTADAAGGQEQQQPTNAAASGSSSAGSTQQQQQQQLPQDWARFSSSGGAAASQQHVQAAQHTSQGSSPSTAAPVVAASAAAVVATSSSSNGGSGGRVPAVCSSSATAADASAPPVATANGYYPSIPGHGFGNSSDSSSKGQQQNAPDMQRLANITARAQAAVAVAGKRAAPVMSTQQRQQQQQEQQQQRQQHAVEDPPVLLERRSQPYSSGTGTSSAPATPSAAASAAEVTSKHSASQGGASSSSGNVFASGRPLAVDRGSSSSSSRQGTSSGTATAPTAHTSSLVMPVSGATASVHSSGGRADNGSGVVAPPIASTAAAADHGHVPSSNMDQSGLAELRAALFGEMDVLRAQVRSLSDQNQAFVFRLKQLEEYAQRQEVAVAKLQEQVETLQHQQHHSSSVVHDDPGVAGSSAAGLQGAHRESNGTASGAAAGQVAGGRFWSMQSTADAL